MASRFRPVFIAQHDFSVVLPFEFFARFEEIVEEKSPGADAFGIGTSFAKFTPNAANGLSIVVSTTMGRFAIHMARQFLQQDVGYS